jgi:RNA polymerase sigma-70 factor (ECF subfamily)
VPHDLLALLSAAGPRLHALLLRLTFNPDLAEELMQELFLKLSRSRPFRQARDPVAYAFRAAIHLALDARQQKSKPAPLPDALAAHTTDPAHALLHQEDCQRLLAVLASLSPQAREAATLHFIQQHSFEETARLMDKTPHQVRALCHDALRQLRAKLNASEFQEIRHD